MRILLVQPGRHRNMIGFSDIIRPEPLVLEILAACLPGHEVEILDLRVEDGLEEKLKSFKPDVVGVTGYTTVVPAMHGVCQLAKSLNPRVVTVVGGYHASLMPQDFDRDYVDVITVGEGERIIAELVDALERGRSLDKVDGLIYRKDGRQVTTKPRAMIADLDSTPLPSRHLSERNRDKYHFHFWSRPALVETARGCPYRCTFCSVWKFHKKICRFKTPERVLIELKQLDSPEIVAFVDDNFLQNIRRAERIYQLIKDEGIQTKYWMQARADSIVRHPEIIEKWASIGLTTILIGFEKFREDELDSLNKKSSIKTNEKCMEVMRKYGVEMWGGFIVDPQWTREDFDACIDYVRGMKITFPQFTVLTPLPGTEFYEEKKSQLITDNYEVFDFLHTVLPTRLPAEEFYQNMARLYTTCTLSLSDIRQRIRSGRFPATTLERVRGLLADVTSADAYIRTMGNLKTGASTSNT